MGLLYGLEPAGNNVVEHRPMRTGKTYYAGQIVKLSTLGSIYTAATSATGIYGVLLEDNVTTASEKTTKVPVAVFSPGALFRAKTSASAGERVIGTLADFALNTTSRYRLNCSAKNQRNFQVVRLGTEQSGTAAGRPIIVSVPSSMSQYIGVGARG